MSTLIQLSQGVNKVVQQFLMFLHERLPNVVIKLLMGQKEYRFKRDIEISKEGEANLSELALAIRGLDMVQPHSLLFYFNHTLSLFHLVDPAALLLIPAASAINENTITFKCEPKLSDELLANPANLEQETRCKRSRQRTIEEAFLLVEQWRYFYREGVLTEEGKKMKCNLDLSSELIGIPRKTLEDYYWLLRTGRSLEFDFRKQRREGMGTLRSFVRQKGKGKGGQKEELNEEIFFKELRFDLLGMKGQEEIFDILKSNRSHSSSDQDMIFQN